jgi:hypothetical protein
MPATGVVLLFSAALLRAFSKIRALFTWKTLELVIMYIVITPFVYPCSSLVRQAELQGAGAQVGPAPQQQQATGSGSQPKEAREEEQGPTES